jgi:repressor LexA
VLFMKNTKSSTRYRILSYIKDFFDEKGYAPTIRDIVKGCQISTTSVVQHHLNQLEKEGHIQRDPQVFRSIRLTEPTSIRAEITEIPLLGTIAAGEPIPVPTDEAWTAEPQEILNVPVEFTGSRKSVFALRVKGSSMIDALIDDGDIVIMETATSIHDGDMVSVWLKDRQEVTLKRIYREAQTIRLQPANRYMSPIIVSPDNVEIQGKVVGVIRKL